MRTTLQRLMATAGEVRGRTPRHALAMSLIVALVLVGCTRATISGARMAEANRLYGEGQYERAIGLYKGLIEAQVADGVVYYNLGNAYYKRGDLVLQPDLRRPVSVDFTLGPGGASLAVVAVAALLSSGSAPVGPG